MRVHLIGRTEFTPPPEVPFTTDADGGQALAEFAGRACYRSWARTVPATATNAGYLDHILQVGHLAVLEHSSATFWCTGLSRSVTHELVRHRHFSYSQLSQRYTAPDGPEVAEPAEIAADPELHEVFSSAVAAARDAHTRLLTALEDRAREAPDGTLARKQARQLARAVLPAATATDIVVTGNYRAWRHFIGMRATEAADVEIRTLALAVLRQLQELAPNVFADFRISTLPDGTEVAASPLVGEG
ncbi:FAD-dependent thymidylate synthase [Nakamurella leprariae]|nr:FAD-dependent thymidylate synthase [Nakamurella leprariae]